MEEMALTLWPAAGLVFELCQGWYIVDAQVQSQHVHIMNSMQWWMISSRESKCQHGCVCSAFGVFTTVECLLWWGSISSIISPLVLDKCVSKGSISSRRTNGSPLARRQTGAEWRSNSKDTLSVGRRTERRSFLSLDNKSLQTLPYANTVQIKGCSYPPSDISCDPVQYNNTSNLLSINCVHKGDVIK